jgi:hypothetical protein
MGRKLQRQEPAQSLCRWRLLWALGNHRARPGYPWTPPARVARHLALPLSSWRLAPFPDARWAPLCSQSSLAPILSSGALHALTTSHMPACLGSSRAPIQRHTAIRMSRRVYHNQAAAHKAGVRREDASRTPGRQNTCRTLAEQYMRRALHHGLSRMIESFQDGTKRTVAH